MCYNKNFRKLVLSRPSMREASTEHAQRNLNSLVFSAHRSADNYIKGISIAFSHSIIGNNSPLGLNRII